MESLNILIVDDEAADRLAIKRYLLQMSNVTFHEATSGQEAEQHLAENTYDCVFLDYSLPDMDGISLLKKFYNAEIGLISSPTVMLTGQGNESVMIDAFHWGAQDYLVKSHISPDVLQVAITKAKEVYELKKNQYRASEQLRQAQKMEAVGRLTSGIAHDFNNILTVVLGNARLLQKKLEELKDLDDLVKEDFIKKIQAIDTGAKKGADLIHRLMIFTRQRPLVQEVINTNDHIQEVYTLLKRTLGETIEIKALLHKEIWPVCVDVSQFENALINIAINARDAMPKGGMLTIETDNIILDEEYTLMHPGVAPGPYIMIAISDTGEGMSPETQKRIFEPFFTTKKAGQGTGLGLSMVYGFIQQSNGYIHPYSEQGHGTIFRIYLPRFIQNKNEELSYTEEAGLPRGRETILIVEDDEEIRKVAVNKLQNLGYRIFEAHNGPMALEILKREKIDLIFTDLVMPKGISGTELVKKARERYPGIKVLYTSGYSEKAIPDYPMITEGELLGKPYRKEKLAQKIRQVLEKEGELYGKEIEDSGH